MVQHSLLNTRESLDLAIQMQVTGKKSVPDAVIYQPSFKIVVETKLYNQFSLEQLKNHILTFGKEQYQLLLTLDPKPMGDKFKEELDHEIQDHNLQNRTKLVHKHLTFEALIEAIEEYVDARDYDMVAILDDYKQYCMDQNLLLSHQIWMRAITAGTTLQDNFELNLYYDKESLGVSEHGYIGLYSQKAVKGIGKLVKKVIAYYENGQLICIPENNATVSSEEKDRIKEAIDRAIKNHGYDLDTVKHRFFLVDQFYPTDFRKTSKNAIQKSKFFNLSQMLGQKTLPDTATIAKLLDGKAWEDFE